MIASSRPVVSYPRLRDLGSRSFGPRKAGVAARPPPPGPAPGAIELAMDKPNEAGDSRDRERRRNAARAGERITHERSPAGRERAQCPAGGAGLGNDATLPVSVEDPAQRQHGVDPVERLASPWARRIGQLPPQAPPPPRTRGRARRGGWVRWRRRG